MNVGFVIGKFMPPHRGHQQLIDFARTWVDRLYIVVESVKGEPIPSTLRYNWMCQLFPDCIVLHLKTHQPQSPDETPDFWNKWQKTLQNILPEPIHTVFASEDYGLPLSKILNAQFIPVDTARDSIPISATKIRNHPAKHWHYIPSCVQQFYRKKISIFGPESTGKTTLSKNLALHFDGTWVPEYARCYLETKGGEIEPSDMLNIARGQSIIENITQNDAKPILFCDTDPRVTNIWSQYLFNSRSNEIDLIAQNHHYDLTIVLDVDVPFVDDSIRYIPERRESFFSSCITMLEKLDAPYLIVQGSWEERWLKAVQAIQNHT